MHTRSAGTAVSWREAEEAAMRLYTRFLRGRVMLPPAATATELRRLGYLLELAALNTDDDALHARLLDAAGGLRRRLEEFGEAASGIGLLGPAQPHGTNDPVARSWGLSSGLDLARYRSEFGRP